MMDSGETELDLATPKQHAHIARYGWKPGQSGNPKGRPPKGLSFAERLRRRMDDESDILIEVALEHAKAGNFQYWSSLMDRYFGRPAVTVERSQDERDLAWAELGTKVAQLLERRAQLPQDIIDGNG